MKRPILLHFGLVPTVVQSMYYTKVLYQKHSPHGERLISPALKRVQHYFVELVGNAER